MNLVGRYCRYGSDISKAWQVMLGDRYGSDISKAWQVMLQKRYKAIHLFWLQKVSFFECVQLQCTATCGAGSLQERLVRCLDDKTGLPSEQCSQRNKPAKTRSCSLPPCPAPTTSGGKCHTPSIRIHQLIPVWNQPYLFTTSIHSWSGPEF